MSLYSIPFARPQCCVGSNPEDPLLQAPIRVAPKPTARSAKKSHNVFYDKRRHPDESEAYDQLLHNIDGGTILRKKKSPLPPPNFFLLLQATNPMAHAIFLSIWITTNCGEEVINTRFGSSQLCSAH